MTFNTTAATCIIGNVKWNVTVCISSVSQFFFIAYTWAMRANRPSYNFMPAMSENVTPLQNVAARLKKCNNVIKFVVSVTFRYLERNTKTTVAVSKILKEAPFFSDANFDLPLRPN